MRHSTCTLAAPAIAKLGELFTDDGGQDLIEYSLLIAFVALGVVGLFLSVGQGAAGVADEGSELLSSANRGLTGGS